MKNQFDLKDYALIQDKENNNWLFMIIIFLITIGIFIILYKFEFSIYEKHTLIKNNNQFFIMINSNKIADFQKERDIYINKKSINLKLLVLIKTIPMLMVISIKLYILIPITIKQMLL